jgi:hypothetical protein
MESFHMFIGDGCQVLRGKNPNMNIENEDPMIAQYDDISSCTISL